MRGVVYETADSPQTYSIFIVHQLGGIWNGCRWTNQDCFSVCGRVIIMGGKGGERGMNRTSDHRV